MRSGTGLKSNPKSVPLSAGVNGPAPTCVAAPVLVLIVYNRLVLPNPYINPLAGRKSMPRIRSPACRPVIGVLVMAPGVALLKRISVVLLTTPNRVVARDR